MSSANKYFWARLQEEGLSQEFSIVDVLNGKLFRPVALNMEQAVVLHKILQETEVPLGRYYHFP